MAVPDEAALSQLPCHVGRGKDFYWDQQNKLSVSSQILLFRQISYKHVNYLRLVPLYVQFLCSSNVSVPRIHVFEDPENICLAVFSKCILGCFKIGEDLNGMNMNNTK